MRTRWVGLLLLVLAPAGLAGPAAALPLILDYTGFSWATPDAGNPQEFEAVGVVNGFSLPVHDPAETYTYYLSQLTLASVVQYSRTQRSYEYQGGDLSVYRSTGPGNRGYAYGTYPDNGTAPSSFIDGTLWLGGGLSEFSVFVDDIQRLAILTAAGQFSGGEFVPALAGSGYFSFAGMTSRPGSGIPAGYGYRMDGQLEVNVSPVPEPSALWLLGGGLLAAAAGIRRRRS